MALTHRMKDITFDIAKRLNDPEQKTYRYLAKSAFVNALSQLVANPDNYEKQEIVPLMVVKVYELDFSTNQTAVIALPQDMMRLINVCYAFSETGAYTGALKEIDTDYAKRMVKEINLQPIHDEIFYWRVGRSMYFRLSNDQVLGEDSPSEKIELEYIKNIDPTDLEKVIEYVVGDETTTDQTDLVKTMGFSLRVVYAAINDAIAMLKGDGIDLTKKID